MKRSNAEDTTIIHRMLCGEYQRIIQNGRGCFLFPVLIRPEPNLQISSAKMLRSLRECSGAETRWTS